MNDYHGNRPYHNFNNDRNRYYVGYRGENQKQVVNRNYNRKEYNKNNSRDWKDNRYASNDHNQKGRDKHENHRRR